MVFTQIKYKKTVKPFFLGALAFFVSQIILRIPLIKLVLPQFDWYNIFVAQHYYIYCIFLGLSAGIFEEVARFVVVKLFLKNNQRFGDGIAFGIGHGGIEAIIIAGLSLINTLVLVLALNNGNLEALLTGLTQAQIDSIFVSLYNLDGITVLLGGIERILAMTMHIGMTMIIFTGFRKNKQIKYLIISILVHGLIDTAVGILPRFGIDVIMLEAVIAIFAVALLIYTIWSKKHIQWQNAINEEND